MAEEVSLRDYLEVKMQSLSDKLDAQATFNALHFDLNERAIKKAEESMTTRLEGMNEFRNQIKDERANLATKDITDALEKRVNGLELTGAKIAGKADQSELTSTKIMAIIAILCGIAGIVLKFLV